MHNQWTKCYLVLEPTTKQTDYQVAQRIQHCIDDTTVYNFGGAVGKSENVAVGASISTTQIDRETKAIIGSKEQALIFNAKNDVNLTKDSIYIEKHGLNEGDLIVYSAGLGVALSGLEEGESYYVIKDDDNNIRLAETAAKAKSKIDIDLTTQGANEGHRITLAPSQILDPTATEKITFNPTGGETTSIDYINPESFNLIDGLLDSATTAINTTTYSITFNSNHGLATGDFVEYRNNRLSSSSTTDIGGLAGGTIYHQP